MLILCDNQDITRVGLQWLCNEMKHNDITFAADKAALATLLDGQEQAVVVLDYTLFDFTSFDELLIWQQRFQSVQGSCLAKRLPTTSYAWSLQAARALASSSKTHRSPKYAKPCTMRYTESHTSMRPSCKWPTNNGKR